MRPIRERRLWARKRPTVPGEPRSDGDRQKPPPTLLFGQAPPRQPLPVESAGNASAKAMPARRCPNEMEHKGARARQSRARKLAVQTCRGCKLRLLRRISFIASWRTALWCRRWRQSVVSAESGGCAALSGEAGRQRLAREWRRNHPDFTTKCCCCGWRNAGGAAAASVSHCRRRVAVHVGPWSGCLCRAGASCCIGIVSAADWTAVIIWLRSSARMCRHPGPGHDSGRCRSESSLAIFVLERLKG